MKTKVQNNQAIPILRSSLHTLITHPVILYPFCVGLFLQLFVLEILYFSPRFPLSLFFGPLIKNLWGELYLHYPSNFILLPKLFYYAQMLIYLFIGSFLTAVTIAIISDINNDKHITLQSIVRERISFYVHIFLVNLLSFFVFTIIMNVYRGCVGRFLLLPFESKSLLFIKKIFIMSESYMNLFFGIIVTSLFVFVIPIIVIEKEKILTALNLNFQKFFKSFHIVFLIVLLPTLFYIPVFILRGNAASLINNVLPELQLAMIVLGIVVTFAIDATIVTAATTFYLLQRESK